MKKTIKLPKPLDYQREIIDWLDDDDVKYVTFLKSRQSGGSFLNKLLTIMWGVSNVRVKIGYITPTYKLSRLFYKELVESLGPLVKDCNQTDLIIKFTTGSYVQFFSAEAKDAIRGFQFNYLIIDEAAFISDDVYNEVIHATHLIKGKKVLMCSTPNSSSGFFHQYYTYGIEQKENYKSKKINIYDNPFVSQDEILNIKSSLPERVFRQEYLSEFLDADGSVFTNFKNCINENPKHTGVYYAGIDWGKTNDYTVLTIMNDLKQVVYIYRINTLEYTTQVKLIVEKLNIWKPKLTISEENNIGQVVNELLKEQYKGQLKRITIDNSEKKNIIENLIVGFEQCDITIPDDEILINELKSFTCVYNHQTKNIKYTAPNGLHDDMVLSLAYAYSIIKTKKGFYSLT